MSKETNNNSGEGQDVFASNGLFSFMVVDAL
jgi:hypothetical protein